MCGLGGMGARVPGEVLDPLLGSSFQVEIVCSGPVFCTFLWPLAS